MATFWAAFATVAATLLAAALGAWITYRVGLPKRRLYYGELAAAPLLAKETLFMVPVDLRGYLKFFYGKTLVKDPWILIVEFVSRGSKDITDDDYNEQPIQFHVGSDIAKILEVKSEPQNQTTPDISSNDTSLWIWPGRIGKSQRITISLLIDGAAPFLDCYSPLSNVSVRQYGERLTWVEKRLVQVAQAVASLAMFAVIIFLLLLMEPPGWLTPVVAWIVAGVLAGALVSAGMAAVAAVLIRRNRRYILFNFPLRPHIPRKRRDRAPDASGLLPWIGADGRSRV